MPTTDQDRLQLYESARTTLGPAAAQTMMTMFADMTPPNGWDDFATKNDLALLRAELRTEMGDLRTEVAGLRGEFKADMADLRGEFKSEIGALEARLLRTGGTWLIGTQAGVIAAVGLILALFQYLG